MVQDDCMTKLQGPIELVIPHYKLRCFVDNDGFTYELPRRKAGIVPLGAFGLLGVAINETLRVTRSKTSQTNKVEDTEVEIKWTAISSVLLKRWNRHLRITYGDKELWVVVNNNDLDVIQQLLASKLGGRFEVV